MNEKLSAEFDRLVEAYLNGERQLRSEAWNLIADFCVANQSAIFVALQEHEARP